MAKKLFYFGDLSYLLKQEYFQDVTSYNYFSEFVTNLKSVELKDNKVVKLQYQETIHLFYYPKLSTLIMLFILISHNI